MESQSDPAGTPGPPDVFGTERRMREASMRRWRFQHMFEPRPSIIEVPNLDVKEARLGDLEARQQSLRGTPEAPHYTWPKYTYPTPEGTSRPIQGSVDRSERLPTQTVDLPIPGPGGEVLEILRLPVSGPFLGPYGRDVTDPAWFSESVDPRTSICAILAPYAAAECVGWGGAWW